MNIVFKKVVFDNFMSYKHGELNFENYSGFTLISGINHSKNDNAKSNGAGKSTILEAVAFAITGSTMRGVTAVKNTLTDGDASVELEFVLDGNVYRVIRTRGNKSDLKIFINGEDKSGKGIKDGQKILEQYLPDLTAEFLGSVILLDQGMTLKFSKNTPSGRKAILENLSKSDYMIEDLKNRICKRKQTISDDMQTIHDNQTSLITRQQSIEMQISSNTQKIEKMDDVEELKNKIQSYTQMISQYRSELEELNQLVDQKTKNRDVLRESYSGLKYEYNNISTKINGELTQANSAMENRKNILSLEISNLEKEIRKIESIKDVCPTCGQKLPNVNKPSCEKERKELDDKKHEYEKIKTDIENNKVFYNRKLNESISDYEIRIKRVENDGKTVSGEITSLQQKISGITNQYNYANSEIQICQTKIDNFNKNKRDIEESINQLKLELEDVKKHMLDAANNYTILDNHLSVIKKFETIATRDFRGVLLEGVIDYLNEKCAEYSQIVFGHSELKLDLDKNNLNICFLDKIYEQLSGGEKQRIDIIIQLALRAMLCQYMNFSSNIFAVDECFDGLDSDSTDRIIDLITTKINDISSVFIISHHTDLCLPIDHVITVIKNEEGISEIC